MNIKSGTSLREKCLYSEFFFSRIFPHSDYGELRSISPYSLRMRENTDQKNSEYGHILRSAFHMTGIPPN